MNRQAHRASRLLLRTLHALAGAVFLLLASTRAAAENTGVPTTIQPMTVSFFIDRKLPKQMRPSIDEAFRRMTDSRCQEVLTDFRDPRGRTLDLNLKATGQGLPAYLGWVIFYDGRSTPPGSSHPPSRSTGFPARTACSAHCRGPSRY